MQFSRKIELQRGRPGFLFRPVRGRVTEAPATTSVVVVLQLQQRSDNRTSYSTNVPQEANAVRYLRYYRDKNTRKLAHSTVFE